MKLTLNFSKRNKKGTLLDLTFIIPFVFAFALIAIISLDFIGSFRDNVEFDPGGAGERLIDNSWDNRGVFDAMIVIFMVGVGLLVVLSAAFIRTLPAFFWISVFLWIFAIMMSAPFGNAFEDFIGVSVFDDIRADFPMTQFIWEHFPLYIMIFGGLTAIVLYIFFERGTG